MSFKTDLGKIYAVRLTHADPFVDDKDVKDAMLEIIDADVIAHKNGAPVDINGAALIKTEYEDMDVK